MGPNVSECLPVSPTEKDVKKSLPAVGRAKPVAGPSFVFQSDAGWDVMHWLALSPELTDTKAIRPL